jgi:uncharacterized protein (DUF1499 family)
MTRYLSGEAGLVLAGIGVIMISILFLLAGAGFLLKGARASYFLPFVLGIPALGVAGYSAYTHFQLPLPDISTDLQKPPAFLHPVTYFDVEKGAEFADASVQLSRDYNLSYGAIQYVKAPELKTVEFKIPMADAYNGAMKMIREQLPNWRIANDDPKALHAEMVVMSPVFNLLSDVILEVRGDPFMHAFDSKVDIRSRARLGFDFLGSNVNRVRDLRVRLELALKPLEEQFAQRHEQWEKGDRAGLVPGGAKEPAPAVALPPAPKAEPKPSAAKHLVPSAPLEPE